MQPPSPGQGRHCPSPVWLGPIELVGGWLVLPSPGIWEAHPLLAVLLRLSGQFLGNFPHDKGDHGPHPSFLSLQGSRGPKGYKVSLAVGTCVLRVGGCCLTFI